MARERLMDDCGIDFEPSEAEQDAWDEGYAAGVEAALRKIEERLNDDTAIEFNLPIEEVLGEDIDIEGFISLAAEIVQQYKNLIFMKLREAREQLKENK